MLTLEYIFSTEIQNLFFKVCFLGHVFVFTNQFPKQSDRES